MSKIIAPKELIDPEGEGIYLHEDTNPSVLLRAAELIFGNWSQWRDIDHKTVYMMPGNNDEWVPCNIGRYPYGWKLNLPKRFFPIEVYVYCSPKPESM